MNKTNYYDTEGHKRDNCWELHPEKRNKDRRGTVKHRKGHVNLAVSGDNICYGQKDLL
jgi:hypothetical protein